jgi:hypothetical protein
MKDITDIGDIILEGKKDEINKLITLFQLSRETLLIDKYNNNEIFNKIKELAVSKGGFLNNNIRKKLWNYLFYKKQNKKNIIDLIKINEDIKVFLSKLNLSSQKKDLTDSKVQKIKEYQIILKDLPRTYQYMTAKNENNKENKITNISQEIFIFTSEKFGYQYLQGLLNIIFYFKQIFNYEDSINAINIYFEFFYKDLIDIKLCRENKDENIALIAPIITDLYRYLFPQKEESQIINYIPILSSKWIISSFLSDIRDINKGFRILDYLIVSEPYVKYVLAALLVNKFHDIISTKHLLNEKLDSFEASYENLFDELKMEDLNSIDIDEIINDVQDLINKKGKEIKNFLIEKYGKNFKYSFNLKNQGLISYYNNFAEIMSIKEPKKEFKIYLGNPKYYIYFFIITSISMLIYYIYNFIDSSRMFW